MPVFKQYTESSYKWGIWKTSESLEELLALLPHKEKYEEDAIYDEGDLLDLVKDDKTLKIFLDTVLANSMRDTKIKRNLEKNKK